MQDNYAVGGSFFSSGGGDRRLRPHNHLNHQALKCPRCESLNTKFCYYNNYNLSQPRHFCKGCRRYWTKGGVLRSVPVGGGCRKTKNTKPKYGDPDAPIREKKSKSQSSSSTDSSSLTAAAVEIGSKTVTATASYSDVGRNPNSDNNQHMMNHSSTNDQMFTSLMTSSEKEVPEDIPTASYDRMRVQGPQLAPVAENPSFAAVEIAKVDELKMHDVARGDWWIDAGGDDDQGMFDLTDAIDPGYWTLPQWNDHDNSINYHP